MDYNFILIILFVLFILYLYKDTFLNKTYRENFTTSKPVDLKPQIKTIIESNYNSIKDINKLKALVLDELKRVGNSDTNQNIELFYSLFITRLKEDVTQQLADQNYYFNEGDPVNDKNKNNKINKYINLVFEHINKDKDVVPSAIHLTNLIIDLYKQNTSNLQYEIDSEKALQKNNNKYTFTEKVLEDDIQSIIKIPTNVLVKSDTVTKILLNKLIESNLNTPENIEQITQLINKMKNKQNKIGDNFKQLVNVLPIKVLLEYDLKNNKLFEFNDKPIDNNNDSSLSKRLDENMAQNTYQNNISAKLNNSMQKIRDSLKEHEPMDISSGFNVHPLTNEDLKQNLEHVKAHKSGKSTYSSGSLSIDLTDIKQNIVLSTKDLYKIYYEKKNKSKLKDKITFYDIVYMLYDLNLFNEFEKNFETHDDKIILYRLIMGDKMVSDPTNDNKMKHPNSFSSYLIKQQNWNGKIGRSNNYPGQDLDVLDKTEFERIQDQYKPLNGFDRFMKGLSNTVEYSDEESSDECSLDQKCYKEPATITSNKSFNFETLFGNNQKYPNPNQTSYNEPKKNKDNYEKLLTIQQNILTSLNKVVKNMTEDKHYSIDID